MNTAGERLAASIVINRARKTEVATALLPLLAYAGCRATIEGDRIAFHGPSGAHSLDILVSSTERILAHWHGFVSDPQNGGAWAVVRRPIRGQERLCDLCDTALVGLIVATDHGSYCSGDCADSEHRAMVEAADDSE